MGEEVISAPVAERVCTRCELVKPFSMFSPHKGGLHGYRSICKACKNAAKKLRQRPVAPLSKKCKSCEVDKPASAYWSHLSTADGLNSCCKECGRSENKSYREANSESLRSKAKQRWLENQRPASGKEWYAKNRRSQLEKKAIYYHKNRPRILASVKAHAQANKEMLAVKRRSRAAGSRHLSNANSKARKAAQRMALPSWFNRDSMRYVYSLASVVSSTTGHRHHVDHVVPVKRRMLQSLSGNLAPRGTFIGPLLPVVQGFHCHANAQVLRWDANISKGNRFWPDMPHYEGLNEREPSPDFVGILPLQLPYCCTHKYITETTKP